MGKKQDLTGSKASIENKPVDQSNMDVVGGKPSLTGTLDAGDMARFNGIIHFNRSKDHGIAWAPDAHWGNAIVERLIRPQHYSLPKQLFVVIDGSAAMQQYMPEVLAGLQKLPDTVPTTIALVGDTAVEYCISPAVSSDKAFTDAIDQMKKYQCVGGQDNAATLLTQLSRCVTVPQAAVLWIHASQPTAGTNNDSVKNLLNNTMTGPLLYDLQVVAGPNDVINGVDSTAALARVSRSGSLSTDMDRLFKAWQSHFTGADYQLVQNAAEMARLLPDLRTSSGSADNLSKIWANQRILQDNRYNQFEALRLAENHQIVSSVSSAVVIRHEQVEERKPQVVKAVEQDFDALEGARALSSIPVWMLPQILGGARGGVSSDGPSNYFPGATNDAFNMPQKTLLSSGAVHGAYDQLKDRAGGLDREEYGDMLRQNKNEEMPEQKAAEKSQLDESLSVATAPALQGATNGTFGGGGKGGFVDDGFASNGRRDFEKAPGAMEPSSEDYKAKQNNYMLRYPAAKEYAPQGRSLRLGGVANDLDKPAPAAAPPAPSYAPTVTSGLDTAGSVRSGSSTGSGWPFNIVVNQLNNLSSYAGASSSPTYYSAVPSYKSPASAPISNYADGMSQLYTAVAFILLGLLCGIGALALIYLSVTKARKAAEAESNAAEEESNATSDAPKQITMNDDVASDDDDDDDDEDDDDGDDSTEETEPEDLG